MAEEYKRAGWYPDPDGVPGERWWNGSGWSDSRRGGAKPSAEASSFVLVPATPRTPVTRSTTPVPPPAPNVIYSAQNPAPQRPQPYGQVPTLSQASGRRIPSSINASVNRNAMIGFVTGLIALFFNILFILAPIAIIFSIMGVRRATQLKAEGSPTTLMAFALVGLGSGILAGFVGLISVVAFVVPFLQLSQ